MLWFVFSLLFLLLAVWIFINTTAGQNWLAKIVTKRLSKDLQTEVTVRHVDFSLFNKMHLNGLLVRDRSKDTLLYAGDVKVRLTDWFFFKDHIELKYIGLEDAVIKFQRSDSVWNQQFLIDYFSSPSSEKKKEGGTTIDLKKLEFKNVNFLQRDAWLGKDMFVHIGAMNLDAEKIDLSEKTVRLTSLTIDEPLVAMYDYDRLKPRIAKKEVITKEVIDSLIQTKPAGWSGFVDKLIITKGLFRTEKQSTAPVLATFDGRHIEFSDIHGEFTGVQIRNDSLVTHLELQAKERSGLLVKKMVSDVLFTPQGMAFNNLDLRTNNSVIKNTYAMAYDDIGDMGSFLSSVKLLGNFEDTEIDSDDIAFFAPALKSWKKRITLNGKVRGTVDDLVGKDMLIRAGNSTLLNGDITMTGLPDINETFIDFKANDFRTTYADAVTIVPAMRRVTSPDLRKIQYVNFKGSFTGFIRDFVTFGTVQTNLGVLVTDLNMKLPSGQDPVYSGNIATDGFRLGDFFNSKDLGNISVTGVVKGKGFSDKSRNAIVDAKVKYIEYKGYRYNNVEVKGKLDKKLFDGFASMQDKEAELTLNGIIDFNQKKPVFNFVADVQRVNLKNLNLIKDDVSFRGKLNLNFDGSNIDNFLGSAKIIDASITKDGVRLPFDSLVLSSGYDNGVKTLDIRSNEMDAVIKGEFNVADLPNSFQLLLNRYYPAYIKRPVKLPTNQSFSFDITTRYIDEYIKLADTSLSGFNDSRITGSLNMTSNELTLDATVPQFKYGKYNFDNVAVSGKGRADSLIVTGSAANIQINDSLSVPLATFRIGARNDSSKVSLYTTATQTVDSASINALVLTYNDGVKIEFDPSTFVIAGKTWSIDENGELQFRKNTPASGLLVLRESDQLIKLKTEPSGKGNWNDLNIELTKINIGDFSPYFMPRNRLEGLVSGKIVAEDPLNNLKAKGELNILGLVLDNDSIGNSTATLEYNNGTGQLISKGKTLNPEHKLDFDLSLFLKDKEKQKDNRISINAYRYPVKILERFLYTLFSDMEGYITGPVDINGPLNQLNISGKAKLESAGLKVNFTQCFYRIQDREIELKPSEISLDGIVLTDSATGNPVYLNGGILHEGFKNMFFDLVVSTRKPRTTGDANNRPVLLLNTTYKDNKQFFGKVKGTGSLSLTGPESEMIMQIAAIASKADSSYVTIPSGDSRESGVADFLVERKFGREMSDSGLKKNTSNIIYDVDITANPMVNVKVVLDELTGDEIKGRGEGNLNIHSGTNEPLTIRGRYNIIDGNYLFTFQSFLKKQFELKKGTENYIEWTGDPYKARINFNALYRAEKISFAPLVEALKLDNSVARYREDVYVAAKLTNELFDPRFTFKLEFPPNSRAQNDPTISFSVDQMSKNENEITRQVTYLIVFNSFAPPETGTNTGQFGSAINEFAYSTISSISGLFFNEVNRKINSELSKILKTDNVSINFSGSLYNRNLLQQSGNSFRINQGDFNVNVPISLFKDRFIVTLGSTLDIPLGSNIQQTVAFLPDVTAEFLINPSGTIRATFFYRQNLDFITTSTGSTKNKSAGVGMAYHTEFDHFFEKKNKNRKKQTETAPVNKDATVTKQE